MASTSRTASALTCSFGTDVDEADNGAAEGTGLSLRTNQVGNKKKKRHKASCVPQGLVCSPFTFTLNKLQGQAGP
jgi:hypothetical protein